MKRIWVYIVIAMTATACEEQVDWELNASENDLIVVEALITNELKSHTVKLSGTIQNLNETPMPVSGAVVAVSDGENIALFHEFPGGSGLYHSDTLQAVINRTYQLYINHQDREFTAVAQMVPATPLKPISFRLVNQQTNFYEINYQDSNEPSMKEYWISWGHLPGFQELPVDETVARAFHYTLESIDVNQAFSPEQEKVHFPAGAYVLRKKYALSEAHQEFLRTFLSETEWRGSVFDVQKGNVRTNLSEGAVGFFAVSTVVADTTIVLP